MESPKLGRTRSFGFGVSKPREGTGPTQRAIYDFAGTVLPFIFSRGQAQSTEVLQRSPSIYLAFATQI